MASGYKNYRRYPRFSILAKAVITRRDEGSPGRLTAMVNTISQGGMGFYTDVLLEKTTPVSVELQLNPAYAGNTLEGKIASICSQGKDYFVGIAFDRELPYDRLTELVG
jgi:hypothetical protein